MSPEDFYARPHEKVRPKLAALARYVLGQARLTSGQGVRVHQYENGKSVVADPSGPSFIPHLKVSYSGDMKITVGAGLVAMQIPRINRVRIDGSKPDGKSVERPSLKIDAPPSGALASWVCVQVTVDPKTGVVLKEEDDPSAVEIVHLHSNERFANGYSPDDELFRGVHPLAMIVWRNAKQIGRLHQVVMHDLQHAYKLPAAKQKGRHFFPPA